MQRSQIMLTQQLNEEIHKMSKRQNVSQSEVVRKLLAQALGMEGQTISLGAEVKESLIYDLATFRFDNQRINGFKEIYSVGGKTTEIKIVGDEVFRNYSKNGKLPEGFEYQLELVAAKLQDYSNNRTIVVRRAYVVPGLDNPPGPRFLGLKVDEVVGALKKIYEFAIENEYHVKDGSQIAVFLHPFVDPKPLSIPLVTGVELPYGGYGAPLNKEASRVEVFAVWGNNEGVQSFDAIDRYVVDSERKIILAKDVPQKNLMLCTTDRVQSDKIEVPTDKQFEQVLSDVEILEVARVVNEMTHRYGLRRVEFSYDGNGKIVFNEAAKYEIFENKMANMDKKGKIVAVASEKDIEKLRKLTDKEVDSTIVYIEKVVIEERAYDLLNNIAGLSNKFTVLYPGLSATAHAMRVLNDFGHTAIVVGNRVFKEGEDIIVKMVDGQVYVEQLSGSSVKNYLVNLYDAKLFGIEVVGGKAANLSLLKSKGFNVPHGWVVTTNFFDKASGSSEEFDKMWDLISESIILNPKMKYAVRSSATVEDQLEHSFAGQFSTFLNVEGREVREKVLAVINSAKSNQVVTYLNALGNSDPIRMAVVIQEMVDVSRSGVVFGKDIQTGDEDRIVIDVARGLGEGVVDGVAKTQRIIYSRNKNKILNKNDGEIREVLDKVEINALIEMAYSVERLMGRTQDIEWAIDRSNHVWLVQSRDL